MNSSHYKIYHSHGYYDFFIQDYVFYWYWFDNAYPPQLYRIITITPLDFLLVILLLLLSIYLI
jgi:hypothetical protein